MIASHATSMEFKQHLQSLLVAYISFARDFLGEEKAAQLDVAKYQQLVLLMAETIEVNHLTDKCLAFHAIEQVDQGKPPEEAAMHCFMLYIYQLCTESSKHPLEEGVIKQRIVNIFPVFERAFTQELIQTEAFHRNADALSHIANRTEEVPALLSALAQEYLRLSDNV